MWTNSEDDVDIRYVVFGLSNGPKMNIRLGYEQINKQIYQRITEKPNVVSLLIKWIWREFLRRMMDLFLKAKNEDNNKTQVVAYLTEKMQRFHISETTAYLENLPVIDAKIFPNNLETLNDIDDEIVGFATKAFFFK